MVFVMVRVHVSVYAYLMWGKFDDHLKWPFQGHVVIHLCKTSTTVDTPLTSVRQQIPSTSVEWQLGTELEVGWAVIPSFPTMISTSTQPLPIEVTMTDFEQHKIDSDQWCSPPFYTHPQGYKMCLRLDANGDGEGTHTSVFVTLMRGEFDDLLKWPFRGCITVAMLNQLESNNHTEKPIRYTETTESEYTSRVMEGDRAPSGLGYPTFIAHTELNYNPTKNCQHPKYDCLCFRFVKVALKW